MGRGLPERVFFLLVPLLLPSAFLGIWGREAYAVVTQEYKMTTSESPQIILDAVLYDGYELNDADEAIALRNLGETAVNLEGWRLQDQHGNGSFITEDVVLLPGGVIWITGDMDAFQRQFGFNAEVLLTPWPGFANQGDAVVLLDANLAVVDALVYEDGGEVPGSWLGPGVKPYTLQGVFGSEGQILYRKLEQASGVPIADTDRGQDWAQDRGDAVNGRKVRYPGWNLQSSFFTTQATETANLTVAIAPDNVFETIAKAIREAEQSIYIESLTAENIALADELAAAAMRGVEVKILLEGGPPGGIADHEKYFCQKVDKAGGQCWFMISDSDNRIADRYRYIHSKFILIDQRLAVISTENLSPNSMPYDDKFDGTLGRRGVVILTDALSVVNALKKIFNEDFDPLSHIDLARWQEDDPQYGAPPADYIPLLESGGISYSVKFPVSSTYFGNFYFEIQQSPENSLRSVDGLIGLLNRVGLGDVVWVQQLVERPHWGAASSNRLDDPNPRLEAYIGAARRGAKVHLMLDEYFDEEGSSVSNFATCVTVNQLARDEGLYLRCDRSNPTGLGIHNKMVLIHTAGQGYVYVGSINGTELSNKGNRELAVLIGSSEAYDLLVDMFIADMTHQISFPVVFKEYQGPANHVLISEVLYDSYGQDEGEFIEIVNPTVFPIDISNYSLSDALNPEDFEDLRRFPTGTVINPGEFLVLATSGQYFWSEYGEWPDFEILDTNPIVEDLIDDSQWGSDETFLRLGNGGDEVLLRDENDRVIDALSYGSGMINGQAGCPLLTAANHSLERLPYWHDSDDCAHDFRDWPFPSPGEAP